MMAPVGEASANGSTEKEQGVCTSTGSRMQHLEDSLGTAVEVGDAQIIGVRAPGAREARGPVVGNVPYLPADEVDQQARLLAAALEDARRQAGDDNLAVFQGRFGLGGCIVDDTPGGEVVAIEIQEAVLSGRDLKC